MNLEKSSFLMFGKTRFGETSTEKIRMVRAVLPDTPKPPQFQPKLQFVHFLPYFLMAQGLTGELVATGCHRKWGRKNEKNA